MNVIDKTIEVFSPVWAAKRAAARLYLRGIGGYDNVPTWRNSGNWHAPDAVTGEGVNQGNRNEARNKARDLERNSEIVNAIISAMVRNVVGKGFNLQVRSDNNEWNNAVEAYWKEWCRPGRCDVTGNYGLTEILALIVRRRFVDGEIMIAKTVNAQAKYPFKLQILEVDNLYEIPANDNVVGGIEIDDFNKPVNFYIQEHNLNGIDEEKYYTIPANRMYYLAYHQRPSEVRGMTPLARTIMEIRNLDEYQDAVAFKEKITSAIAVWIVSDKETGGGYGVQPSVPQNASVGSNRIKPGSVNELPPGKNIQTLVPSGQASEYSNFNMATLRRIAAGHGLSYEIVTRDVSQVTYSSARQNLLEDWKLIEIEQQYLISHFLDFVFEDVVEYAVMSGEIKAPIGFDSNRAALLKHEFIGQGMPWIDPKKEADGNTALLSSCQTTLKELYAKRGKDWEEELKQAALEHQKLLDAGLIGSEVKDEKQGKVESGD